MKTVIASTTDLTLDIHGTTYTKVPWKVGLAVAFVGLGVFLLVLVETPLNVADAVDYMIRFSAFMSFFVAAVCPFNKHTYLNFTGRQVVTLEHYAWYETPKRCRPLTDFRNIVVRHLCIPGGEGPDTYTGSVGLRPVDGRAVLWVKSFPTTEAEVPRTAYEFARKLQEMKGLPGAPGSEFKTETQ
jgi:hypothetical protein